MNDITYITKDPILNELNNSVDKESTKKMIAFKHFNNNINLLDDYLQANNVSRTTNKLNNNLYTKRIQLEFSF